MKTNFALGITQSGVTLWQRGERGWLRVGAVALDHPDMDTAVADLVKTAKSLVSDTVLTQLVIPEDQVLYTRITAPGPGVDAQRSQIRKALEGRTPFPVEELDFDWTGAGPDVDVAVVARETLIEAEDFAKKHGLNPACFVAAPVGGAFNHAPFFGHSRILRALLGDPATLTRDREILRETGAVPPPAPVAQPAKPAKADAPAPNVPADSASAASQSPKPAQAPQDAVAPRKTAKPDVTPTPAPVATPKAKTDTKTRQDTLIDAEPKSTKTATVGPAMSPIADVPVPTAPVAPKNGPEQVSIGFKSRRTPPPLQDAINAAPPAAPLATKDAKTLSAQKQKLAELGLAARSAPAAVTNRLGEGFRSKYASANARISESMGQLRARLQSATKKTPPSPVPDAAALRADTPNTGATPPAGAVAPARGAAQPTTTRAASPAKAPKPATPKDETPPTAAPAAKTALAGAIAWPKAADNAAPARKTPLETLRSLGQNAAAGTAKSTDPEAERLTVFGARGNSAGPGQVSSGQGTWALIGGGVLMIAVAAGIYAFYFARPSPLDAPVTLAPPPEAALDTPETLSDDLITTDADDIEAALGLEDVAQRGPAADTSVMNEGAPTESPGDTAVDADQGSAPTPEREQGRIAGLRSPALIMPQDLSPLPERPATPDPFGTVPLPPLRSELAQSDAPAPVQGDPATNDGAQSALPTGEDALEIDVTQGRPGTAPPEKPVRFTLPEPPAQAPADAPDPDANTADMPARQSSAAASTFAPSPDIVPPNARPDERDLQIGVTPGRPPVVPPARPEGLAPQSDQSQDQGLPAEGQTQQAAAPAASAGGLALTALRPASRPSDLTARAGRTQDAAAAQIQNTTPQAVAASLRPSDRPSKFASTVQRALSASTAAAPASTAGSGAQRQDPVQTASAAAMPRIPTSTSVSREATQARAINLRQVNLIGVMGTASNRRALVRLSNGRVMTVRVGESLDGGQVTAIGETELRYNRRGRDVVLRIAS
ncbi:hypothetical protein [Roseinatronobacter sp. NSM]|uniref:hypothetical protein n=1 Tax=Roseinatronobacter sp. NSM TaxID=3457785 RepID=UPI004035AE97